MAVSFSFEAEPGDAGLRLDVWLERRMPAFSRTRIKTLIENGYVAVQGREIRPNSKVIPGDHITVSPPPTDPEPAALPQPIPLSVLYDDGDLVVINKPAGLVVHPAPGHRTGTVVNAILHHCRDIEGIGGTLRPGIVHRLDKDTSGALVIAKNETALNSLMEQFKAGTVEKRYVALVRGVPAPRRGTIETLIARHPRNRKKMSVQKTRGRRAVTHYEVTRIFPESSASLLEVRIETGRTHQIRVHLSHIGHPVLGDSVYGRARTAADAPRQMLHARSLAFAHPRTGEAISIEAPLPDDFQALLETLA